MVASGPDGIHNTGLQQHKPASVSMYSILSRLITLYRQLKKQERYLKDYLPVLLAEVVPDHHQTFSPSQIKRTTKYWQLSLNLICENLYQLTGKKLQESEHKRIVLLSVFGPLFDDLFDDRLLEHEQISSLVTRPEAYVPVNATDQLVKEIYLELLRLSPQRDRFIQHLQELSHWEKASLKQLSNNITEEELYLITYNKSYFAILLFCAVLDHYPGPEILEILYPAAGLMQLTNDAFDVWKDLQNGSYTLPNLYRNFDQLQQQFLADSSLINNKLCQLPYSQKARQRFSITIHSLHAMGWMALEQLKEVTAGISTFAELSALSRKELVCDMDNVKQQLKWLKHVQRFTNHYAIPSPKHQQTLSAMRSGGLTYP